MGITCAIRWHILVWIAFERKVIGTVISMWVDIFINISTVFFPRSPF